ncbi:hypothetical protein CLV63_11924 [Murinocardiopsis flavida]|uniref:Uncharacterized protein n=1 Tax=Murinocardiopsis flavida TaxID=645275 RepID=A0A2P8D3E8_9ACTN|nr:hypothetical protein [Murinocardiopsis flavida]PSK91743.1 hypothetical protein CLV63_11924 [Murinocardiopsis flavida]
MSPADGPAEPAEAALADQAVDSVRERLAALDDLPTVEHVAVFEQVHGDLSAVLNSLDSPSNPG